MASKKRNLKRGYKKNNIFNESRLNVTYEMVSLNSRTNWHTFKV